MKAGRIVSGEVGCENAVKGGKAKLIIVAADASENTKNKFANSAKFYGVDIIEYGTKTELGYAMGKAERSVAAVTDEGFSAKLIQMYKNGHN